MNINDLRAAASILPDRTLPGRAVLYVIWARVMPVAVTYANSGLVAALAAACSVALADDAPCPAGRPFPDTTLDLDRAP
jgi:hypothetical protein